MINLFALLFWILQCRHSNQVEEDTSPRKGAPSAYFFPNPGPTLYLSLARTFGGVDEKGPAFFASSVHDSPCAQPLQMTPLLIVAFHAKNDSPEVDEKRNGDSIQNDE